VLVQMEAMQIFYRCLARKAPKICGEVVNMTNIVLLRKGAYPKFHISKINEAMDKSHPHCHI
jgi:hypothetical protein